MKAGRELDALVAKEVMGWKRNRSGPPDITTGRPKKWDKLPFEYVDTPRFSTDIAAAWMVLDNLTLTMWPEVGRLSDGTWYCEICRGSEDVREITPSIRVIDSTAPHVICLAALLAIGVSVPL